MQEEKRKIIDLFYNLNGTRYCTMMEYIIEEESTKEEKIAHYK
jgi:hypothetical protein